MSRIISRRTMIACGITAVAGAAAVRVAGRYGLIPPDSGGVFGRDRPPPAGTTMN